jgi:hypothetical protein
MKDEVIQTDGDPNAILLKPEPINNNIIPFLSNTNTLKQSTIKEEPKMTKNCSSTF